MLTPTDLHPLPVGVLGCGRMGRLHARAYSQIPQVKLVGVYDASPAAAAAAAGEYGGRAFGSMEEMLGEVRAVSIAAPTQAHLSAAEPFLQRGIACLIEKPLARDEADCQRIVDLAKKHKALVQVGHIERFNPAVRAVARLNLAPRFLEVHRVSPMTFRSLDVGVVLDIMIHDIDIILSLVRSPVERVDATGVSVLGQVEDVVNARLTFADGCVANLTASRLAFKTDRRLRLFAPDAFVSIDYAKKQGVIIRRDRNLDTLREAAAQVRSGAVTDLSKLNYSELIRPEPLVIEDVEQIRAQLDAFIHSVATGSAPIVSAEDGLAAVQVAGRIVKAIAPAMHL